MSVYAGPNTTQSGLVLHIDPSNPRCYPGSGSTLFDLSGGGNNGTLTNGASVITNRAGRALDFDYVSGGNRQAVELPNRVSVRGFSAACLSLWCNLQTGPADNAALYYESTATEGFTKFGIFQSSANQLIFVCRDTTTGSSFSVSHTPTAGQWNHVAGNYNASNDLMELFVNGISVGTNTTAKGNIVDDAPATEIAIGAFTRVLPASAYSVNALIDDVRVYNRALSDSEILNNFNATRGRYGI